ncbi:hypothetical protein CAF53_02535 [Sphingobium sp. LB126]|nr:hypothetical protein CAF53_02535 [Sphingobium sp. LB126]
MVGRWVLSRGGPTGAFTRVGARRQIEQVFIGAVREILDPIDLAELRVSVLHGEGANPPAIGVFCSSAGQLDLGWIEDSDAPIPWRAAAYQALEETLGRVLPVFGYDDLFEEIAMYYWEGETDDEAARQCLINYHGADPDDLDEMSLPCEMNARRPDWMLCENAAPLCDLPDGLRTRIERLRSGHSAVNAVDPEHDAWQFESETLSDYVEGLDECAHLPPLTLVPAEHFARELDDVGRHGMEMGFTDAAGLYALSDADCIDDWFTSLKLGVQFLISAQDLINLDPSIL